MGEYKDGKWHPTWGDDQFGVVDTVDGMYKVAANQEKRYQTQVKENKMLLERNVELASENRRLRRTIEIKSEYATARLCSDHKGKWGRGTCVLCENETLRKLTDADEKEIGSYTKGTGLRGEWNDLMKENQKYYDAIQDSFDLYQVTHIHARLYEAVK